MRHLFLTPLKGHFFKYSWFYGIFALFIVFGALVLFLFPEKQSVLYLNETESHLLDSLFVYITKMGEWLGGVLIALLILIFRKLKYLMVFFIALIISSSATNLLKRSVFDERARPAGQFESEIKRIDGISLHKMHSFPSGHTTAAFCMFSVLAFAMKSRVWQITAVLLACLTGISRVYLAQHFPSDVLAGAILGTLIASLVMVLTPETKPGQLLNKGLRDLL